MKRIELFLEQNEYDTIYNLLKSTNNIKLAYYFKQVWEYKPIENKDVDNKTDK